MHSAAIIAAKTSWTSHLVERLHPGAYVALLTDDEYQAIEARRAGFELRDTLLLLWPQTTSFVFLLRAPFPGGTTDQIELTGTGVLNVDACRVEGGGVKQATAGRRTIKWGVGEGGCTYEKGTGAIFTTEGRWPANACFIHGPSCRRVGEKRIDGHKGYPNGPGGSSVQFSQKGTATTRKGAWQGHADADGKETIAVWDCQDNCPVGLVDRQTPDLKSRSNKEPSLGGGGMFGHPKMDHPFISYGDAGGASRFYPQFASPWELLGWLRTLISTPGGELLEEV